MRRMTNRSGPPRFPLANARIFITLLNGLDPMIDSQNAANLLVNDKVDASVAAFTDLRADRFASSL
jgi:hypothetical protein